MSKPALVGIVPRKDLWPVIENQRWYHIPVKSAPLNALKAEYLAFYFPAAFGKDLKHHLRFSGKEIHRNLKTCLTTVNRTIHTLDDVKG